MKVAVIGIGYIGIHHLRNLNRLKREGVVDELYASDIDTTRKEDALRYEAVFYDNYLNLLDEARPDLVILAVPSTFHYKMGMKILEKGVNLLVEKPLCIASKECREMIRLAEKNGLMLTVGHIERFNPVIKQLLGFIKEGRLGEIISMASRRHGGPRKVDTGIVLDIGVHDIDIMRYISGREVMRVYCNTLKRLRDVKNEDYAVIVLEFEDSIIGTVEVGRLTSVKIRELNIIGTLNYVNLDYIKQEFTVVENYLGGGGWRDYMDFIKKSTPIKKMIKAGREEPLYIELKDVIMSLKEGREPIVTAYDGLRAVEISEAAIKSSKLGLPVEISYEK